VNHLSNLIKKELKELLTVGSVVSLFVMLIVLSSMGAMIGDQTAGIDSPSKVGVIDDDETTYSQFAVDQINGYYGADAPEYVVLITDADTDEKLINAMTDNGLDTLLVIENGFGDNIDNEKPGVISIYWHQTSAGLMSSISTITAYNILAYVSNGLSKELISDPGLGLAPDFVMNPINSGSYHTILNGTIHGNVTPSDVYDAVNAQTMFIPIMIMMIIITIGSTIIGSIGNEKENKTMETLLTLPVKRTTIVGGKLIGSAIVGLIYGGIYMVGIYFMMNGMGRNGNGMDLNDLGLALSITDWGAVIIMLFLAIMCALGMCMILGAFAKNYKSAQTMTLPLSVLAMVPMFITMFSSFHSLPSAVQALTFAIPFSHPMMVMQNLMFGETMIVIAGLIYLLAFSLITMYITVRLYRSDILITGLIRKKKDKKVKG